MNKKRFVDYHENLLERLQDPKFAAAYLNEAVLDEDQRVFLLALKDVIEAYAFFF
jgi:DNA-binding phage protein